MHFGVFFYGTLLEIPLKWPDFKWYPLFRFCGRMYSYTKIQQDWFAVINY